VSELTLESDRRGLVAVRQVTNAIIHDDIDAEGFYELWQHDWPGLASAAVNLKHESNADPCLALAFTLSKVCQADDDHCLLRPHLAGRRTQFGAIWVDWPVTRPCQYVLVTLPERLMRAVWLLDTKSCAHPFANVA
jgi:hypothetical protein